MKIFGTTEKEISIYFLDAYSILHFITGFICYFVGFWLLSIFFTEITAILLCYICLFIGGIVWELVENTLLIDMKVFKHKDTPINSQVDVLLVFFGGVVGCYTYNLHWITNIILIGLLFVMFTVCNILTKIKFWKRKSPKNLKKNDLINQS